MKLIINYCKTATMLLCLLGSMTEGYGQDTTLNAKRLDTITVAVPPESGWAG